MTGQQDDEAARLLAGAYALQTPADNLEYYRDFAGHYDASFADAMGYIYPQIVATHFANQTVPAGPVLDVGCGTGLVAACLHDARANLTIDGVDLSPEMLDVARTKGQYDRLFEVDLTGGLDGLPTGYAGMISAGTFTHGHIGPAPLVRLVAHCRPGAVALIGVNSVHYDALGFAPVIRQMTDDGLITAPRIEEVKIFDGADARHAEDTAQLLQFIVI